jgi:GT2 family glycosyltransferase
MIAYLYPVTLSIVIVNYNVKYLVEQCLRSLSGAASSTRLEVIVVDNASTDNSIAYLTPLFPEYRFIPNATNVGFAKANNMALQYCTGDVVLFLNPDTILPRSSLDKCMAFLLQQPDAGALGVRMINDNGKFLRESKRGLPTPAASFWKLAGFAKLFPTSSMFAGYYAAQVGEFETKKVDVLSGAFMMIRKNVLDKIGGFDERFFMYAEDIDLSYRIIKAGFNNYYFPEVTIIHLKGASTKKDSRYVRQFYKAMSQYVRKHYGNGPYALLLDTGIVLRGGIEALRNFLVRSRKRST